MRPSSFVQAATACILVAGARAPAQDCSHWILAPLDAPAIPPHFFHAAAFDSARGRLVVFGGQAGREYFDFEASTGTWEWDGKQWEQRATTGPAHRLLTTMVYDVQRGVTVMFGGALDNATWEWDGSSWTRRDIPGPPSRSQHAMAFDSARGVTVLFGGYAEPPFGDTWEYDGEQWTQRNIAGPSARFDLAMAFDSRRNRVVLFGGNAGVPPGDLGDTWEYDGEAWELVSTEGPSRRASHAMAYDASRDLTVLVGGRWLFNPSRDAWEWDGEQWRRGPSLPYVGRSYAAMAYDTTQQDVLLFGGTIYPMILGDLLALDADGWTRLTHDSPPVVGQVVADPSTGHVYLHHSTSRVPGARSVLWSFDGSGWVLRGVSDMSPSLYSMAFDTDRRVMVFYTGIAGVNEDRSGTWEFDGVNWLLRDATSPLKVGAGSLVYDESRHVTVMLTGELQTREWNGTAWSVRQTLHSPPDFSLLVYDPDRQRVIARDAQNQLWEYDGADWFFRPVKGTPQIPGPLVYHRARHSLIQLGMPMMELVEDAWTPIPSTPLPPRIRDAVYDPAADRILVVSQRDTFDHDAVLWQWTGKLVPSPVITDHPANAIILRGEDAQFTVDIDEHDQPVEYLWRRNGLAFNGTPRFSGFDTPTLSLHQAEYEDSGAYDVAITYACGQSISSPARLIVTCTADWNSNGILNSQDFFDFLIDFFAGNADLDADGDTDFDDYTAMFHSWMRGCR